MRILFILFLFIGFLRAECFYDNNNPLGLRYLGQENTIYKNTTDSYLSQCIYNDGTNGTVATIVTDKILSYSESEALANLDSTKVAEIFLDDLRSNTGDATDVDFSFYDSKGNIKKIDYYERLCDTGNAVDEINNNIFMQSNYEYLGKDPNITLIKDTEHFYISFWGMKGVFHNSLGYYAYNKNVSTQGNINSIEPKNQQDLLNNGIVIFPNIEDKDDNGQDIGVTVDLGFFPKNTKIVFFLIANSFGGENRKWDNIDDRNHIFQYLNNEYSIEDTYYKNKYQSNEDDNTEFMVYSTISSLNFNKDERDGCRYVDDCSKHVSMLWRNTNSDGTPSTDYGTDSNSSFNRYVIMAFEDLQRSRNLDYDFDSDENIYSANDFNDTVFALASYPVDALSINVPTLDYSGDLLEFYEDEEKEIDFNENELTFNEPDGTPVNYKELNILSSCNNIAIVEDSTFKPLIDNFNMTNSNTDCNLLVQAVNDDGGLSNQIEIPFKILAINDAPTLLKDEVNFNPDNLSIEVDLINDLKFNPNDREDENDALNGFIINDIKVCDSSIPTSVPTTLELLKKSYSTSNFTIPNENISDGDCLIFNITAYDSCINHDDMNNIEKDDGHCSENLGNSEFITKDIKFNFTGYPTETYNEKGVPQGDSDISTFGCSDIEINTNIISSSTLSIDEITTHKDVIYSSDDELTCSTDVKLKILDINNAPTISSDKSTITLEGNTEYIVNITKEDIDSGEKILFADSVNLGQSIEINYIDSETDKAKEIELIKDSPTDIVISYGSLDDTASMTECTSATDICTSISTQILSIFDNYINSDDKSKLDFSTLNLEEDIKVETKIRVYDTPVCEDGFNCDEVPKLSNELPLEFLIEARKKAIYSLEIDENAKDATYNIKQLIEDQIGSEIDFTCDNEILSDYFNIDKNFNVNNIVNDMEKHHEDFEKVTIIEDKCKVSGYGVIINMLLKDVNNPPTIGDSNTEYSKEENPFKYTTTELAPSSNYIVDIQYADSENDKILEESLAISDLKISVEVNGEYQECTQELNNVTCNNLSSIPFQNSSISLNEDNRLNFSTPDLVDNLKLEFMAKVEDSPQSGDITSKDSNLLPIEVVINANDLGENIIIIPENSIDEINISSYSESLSTTTCPDFNNALTTLTLENNYSIIENSIKVFNDTLNHKNYEYSLSGCTTSNGEAIDVTLFIQDVNNSPTIDNDSDRENDLDILILDDVSENETTEDILKQYTINSFIDKLNYSDSESDELKSFEVLSIDKITLGETSICEGEACGSNSFIDKTKFKLNSENMKDLDFSLPNIDDDLTINFTSVVHDNPLCSEGSVICDEVSKISNELDIQVKVLADKPKYIEYEDEEQIVDACSVILNFDKDIESVVDVTKISFSSNGSTVNAKDYTINGTEITITSFNSITGCLDGATKYSITSPKDNFGPELDIDVDDIVTTKSLLNPTASDKTVYIYEDDGKNTYEFVLSTSDPYDSPLDLSDEELIFIDYGSKSCSKNEYIFSCNYSSIKDYKDNSFKYKVCREDDSNACSNDATVNIIRGIHLITDETTLKEQKPCSSINMTLEFDKDIEGLTSAVNIEDFNPDTKINVVKSSSNSKALELTLSHTTPTKCLEYSGVYPITIPKEYIKNSSLDILQSDVEIFIETEAKNPEVEEVDFIATEDGEKEYIYPDVIDNSLESSTPKVEVISPINITIDTPFSYDKELDGCKFLINDTLDIPSDYISIESDNSIFINPYSEIGNEWSENSEIELTLSKNCIVSSDDETKSLLNDISVTFQTLRRKTPPELIYVEYLDGQNIDVKKENSYFETAINVPLSTDIVLGFSVPIKIDDNYKDGGYIEIYDSVGNLFQKTNLDSKTLVTMREDNEIELKLEDDLESNSSYYVLIKSDNNIDKSYCLDTMADYSEAVNSEVSIYDTLDSNGCQIFDGVYSTDRIKFTTSDKLCLIKENDSPKIEYINSKIYIYYNRAIVRGDGDYNITLYNKETSISKKFSVYDSEVSIDRNILIINVINFLSKSGYNITLPAYIVQDANRIFTKDDCGSINFEFIASSENILAPNPISIDIDDEVNPYFDNKSPLSIDTIVKSTIDGEYTKEISNQIDTIVPYNNDTIKATTDKSTGELNLNCQNSFYTDINKTGSNTLIEGDILVTSVVDNFKSELQDCKSLESVQKPIDIIDSDEFVDILDGNSKFIQDGLINTGNSSKISQFATEVTDSTLFINNDDTMRLEVDGNNVIVETNIDRNSKSYFKNGTTLDYTLRDENEFFEDGSETIIRRDNKGCNIIEIRTKVTKELRF